MTQARVRKAGPPDLIATLWFRLGFIPRESLVVARLDGPKQEIGSAARVDLPPPELGRPGQREATRLALDPILTHDPGAPGPATAVVAMIASERALDLPGPRILPVLRREVQRRGLRLVDVVGVTSTVYRSLDCPDRRCCPVSGRSVEEVMSSRAAMAHVLSGTTLVPTEQGLVADVRPSPAAEHLARADPVNLSRAERRRWWERWVSAFEATRDGVPDPRIDLSGLAGALHDPDLRDAVLMHLLGVDPAVLPSWVEGGPSNGPPDEERLRDGEALLAAIVRPAAPGARGPALALLALLAWCLGRTSRARVLLGQAQADGRPLPLAELVDTLLGRFCRPPWTAGAGPGGD